MNKIILIFLLLHTFRSISQYAPVVGEIGSTAISKDSSIFQFWVNKASVHRGWQNLSNKSLGEATLGDVADCIGQPDGRVISLGDSGNIVLSFPHRIQNGAGYDFAVFENSFNNTFLELAFVEVSSDSIHFVRFPSVSLTPVIQQLGNDAIMDATNISNLAGKYRGSYGTPFDLEEMKDSSNIDLNNIRFIRLIDVVGSINQIYGSKDSKGNLINDPFPTPYPSSGFDLDAVGVINSEFTSVIENSLQFKVWPNPVSEILYIDVLNGENIELTNMMGECVFSDQLNEKTKIDVSNYQKGIYFIRINNSVQKISIQ